MSWISELERRETDRMNPEHVGTSGEENEADFLQKYSTQSLIAQRHRAHRLVAALKEASQAPDIGQIARRESIQRFVHNLRSTRRLQSEAGTASAPTQDVHERNSNAQENYQRVPNGYWSTRITTHTNASGPDRQRQVMRFMHPFDYADTKRCLTNSIIFVNNLRPIAVASLKEEDYVCTLCLDDLKDELTSRSHRPIQLGGCSHLFGESCIRVWLNPLRDDAYELTAYEPSKTTCPLCRTVLFWRTCHAESLLGLYIKLRLWDTMYGHFQIEMTKIEALSRASLYRFVADEVLHNGGSLVATNRTWRRMLGTLRHQIHNFARRVTPLDIRGSTFLMALEKLTIVPGLYLRPAKGNVAWNFVIDFSDDHPGRRWWVLVLAIEFKGTKEGKNVYGGLTWIFYHLPDLPSDLAEAVRSTQDRQSMPA